MTKKDFKNYLFTSKTKVKVKDNEHNNKWLKVVNVDFYNNEITIDTTLKQLGLSFYKYKDIIDIKD